MFVNYCGNCGAAARPQVRFCRQCGFGLAAEPETGVSPAGEQQVIAHDNSRALPAPQAAQQSASNPVLEDSREANTAQVSESSPPSPSASVPSARKGTDNGGKGRPPRATALAQASGLEGASAFGMRIRPMIVLACVLIVGIASLIYYRQSLRLLRVDRPERNLVTPEEQSLDLIQAGKQASEIGQYFEAIERFKEALALTPQHSPIHLLLAQSYQASGQVNEALRSYATLLRQDPQNLEARFEVAEVHRQRGNWKEAYQEYQRIIAINSESVEALAALEVIEAHDLRPLGPVRVDVPKHRAVARHKFASLLPPWPFRELSPTLPQLRVRRESLGAPPTLLPRNDEAERGDARALAESHKSWGARYHNAREFLAAIREFSIAQQYTPGDKDLFYLLGSCYDGLGQDALAHEFYKQCNSGPYASVARSGAQRTAKAARAESRRQDNVSEVDTSQSRPVAPGFK